MALDCGTPLCKLHCEDRPSFFIPGITGKARCLSNCNCNSNNKCSNNNNNKVNTTTNTKANITIRNIAIDLQQLRQRKLRGSSRSAPDRGAATGTTTTTSSCKNVCNSIVAQEQVFSKDDETMGIALSIYDSIMLNRNATKRSSILGLDNQVSRLSTVSEPLQQAPKVPKQQKQTRKKIKATTTTTTTSTTSLDFGTATLPEQPTTTRHDDVAFLCSVTYPGTPTSTTKSMKHMYPLSSNNLPSPMGVLDLELQTMSLQSPTMKSPCSSFLPHHLLYNHSTPCSPFQPFGADDDIVWNQEMTTMQPPPLLGSGGSSSSRKEKKAKKGTAKKQKPKSN